MKTILMCITLTVLVSCSSKRFKHNIGDVTIYKIYSNKVLILDTVMKNNKPYYIIEDSESQEIVEVSEIELADGNVY